MQNERQSNIRLIDLQVQQRLQYKKQFEVSLVNVSVRK